MTLAQYRTYFEALAARSKDIAHNPAGAKKRFALINLGDTLSKIRSVLDTTNYCLILEKYDARRTRRTTSSAAVVTLDCSFKILRTYPPDNYELELQYQSEAHVIAEEFVKEIELDSYNKALPAENTLLEELIDYLPVTLGPDGLTGVAVYLRFSRNVGSYKRAACGPDANRTAHWNT